MKKYLNLFMFSIMVAVNCMATAGSIGNIATKDVSEMYPSLLTPANLTFSIWGIIYLSIGALVIWQMLNKAENFRNDFTGYFTVSCLLNIAWIFSWHKMSMGLSFALMFLLLAVLMMMSVNICEYSTLEKAPVNLYAGWVNIAFYANLAALIGLNNTLWSIIILTIATAQIVGVIFLSSTVFYALAAAWGITGIAIANYGHENMLFIFSVCYAIIILLTAFIVMVKNKDKKCMILN